MISAKKIPGKLPVSKLAGLALATMGLAAFPSLSWAGASATLPLQGTVSPYNDIEITTNGSNNLTLDITGGESAQNIATATEASNDANGYTISMSSTNGGELELGGTSTSQKTGYQISYDGGSYISPTTSAQVIKTVNSLTGLTTHASAVLITVTADPNALAGAYTDTVLFSIAAN